MRDISRQLCLIPAKRTNYNSGSVVRTINFMIVDDHPLVRRGLRQLVEIEPDLTVCCEAATMADALQLLEQYTPDLAIVDLSLPDGNGLDLIKRMKIRHPEILILVSSMHDEDLYAKRVLRAGAKGYINKQQASEEVIIAARRVLAGKVYLSPEMTERFELEHGSTPESPVLSPLEHLSDRELEVFELIGHGKTTSAIADLLHLSVKTIETHRANIKLKLGLQSAGELVRSAVEWSLDTY